MTHSISTWNRTQKAVFQTKWFKIPKTKWSKIPESKPKETYKMTPHDIIVLLAYHTTSEEFHDQFYKPESPAAADSRKNFVREGILATNHDIDISTQKLLLTLKGQALVRMLENTPMPTQNLNYIDPRTGEEA